jgi:uncharacterized membrane protein HdeD (DUF308 family)
MTVAPLRIPATGVVASRLPEPTTDRRRVHAWRAVGLIVIGLFAVLSPGSLTSAIVVILGLAALYFGVTEALAAWHAPRAPRRDGAPTDSAPTQSPSTDSAPTAG